MTPDVELISAQRDRAVAILADLVQLYVMNQDTKYEFIACKILEKRSCTLENPAWRAWQEAKAVVKELTNPPTCAHTMVYKGNRADYGGDYIQCQGCAEWWPEPKPEPEFEPEFEYGPYTACGACSGNGCDRCMPHWFEDDVT